MRPLTESECRVLERLAEKDRPTLRAAAADMGWTVNTVKTLATRAYRKLGAHGRYEAVAKHRRLRGHLCDHLRLRAEREAAV